MPLTRLILTACIVFAFTSHAFADATLFIGSTTSPTSRAAKGFAIGAGIVVVGFEFEYSDTGENVTDASPSLRTGVGNLILQTPGAIAGVRPYFTTGGGGYRERLGTQQETQVALNTGGGVKISVAGPLRLRLDYRVFKLRGEPVYATVHRFYAGANVTF